MAEDRVKKLAARARYREKHKERLKEKAREYFRAYSRRPEVHEKLLERKRLARKALYWSAEAVAKREAREALRKVSKELAKERRAADRAKNPEKYRLRTRLWRQANPEKRKLQKRADKARRRGATGRLSPGRIKDLFSLQRGKCPVCLGRLDYYHVDHILPIALGGTNTDDNVQLLCPQCNIAKGAKHPSEFAASLGLLM